MSPRDRSAQRRSEALGLYFVGGYVSVVLKGFRPVANLPQRVGRAEALSPRPRSFEFAAPIRYLPLPSVLQGPHRNRAFSLAFRVLRVTAIRPLVADLRSLVVPRG